MINGGGQFTPILGGHFELESNGHFKLELSGQYDWNLQFIINSRKKTLTTLVHANAYQQGKTIFKYNSKSKKWKVYSKTLVDY